MTKLDRTQPIVDKEGLLTTRSKLYFDRTSSPIQFSGTGSPEGVIEASQRTLYMDEAGGAGAVLYVKRDTDIAGDRTMGWILI